MSHQKSRLRTWVEIGAAALLLAAVFVWSEGLLADKVGPATVASAASPELSDAATARVAGRQLAVEVEVLGTVRPLRDAALAARIMGVVERVTVEEGDLVEAGDVLVELTAPELLARGRAARQQVEAARAQRAQAERDLARMETLAAREAATAVELEQARTAVRVAAASVASARQAARGEEAVASYTTLRAPTAGRVVARLVDPGDLATPGAPLLRIENESAFRLEAPLDERLAERVRLGDAVSVSLDALGVELAGVVGEVEAVADAGSRTVLVKVDLPARDGLRLRSGLFGRARLGVGMRAGVVAPLAAVQRVGGLTTARVLTLEGRVLTRHVRLGAPAGPGLVEVLSGLEAGETVVLLRDPGSPVPLER